MLRIVIVGVIAIVSPLAVGAAVPQRLLLIGQGPDGHPPATHEYVAGLKILEKCLKPLAGVEVTRVRADEPWREGPELIGRVDGVVLFLAEGARWINADPKRLEALTQLTRRGGAVVGLHWGIGTRDAKNIEAALTILGGCHGGPDRKYQLLETDVSLPHAKHPIASGLEAFRVRDEFYYKLKVSRAGTLTPILQARIDGVEETVAWAWERPDGGRSFGFSGLHFHENWKHVAYRRLVAQGVLWTLKLPIPKGGFVVNVSDGDLKLK